MKQKNKNPVLEFKKIKNMILFLALIFVLFLIIVWEFFIEPKNIKLRKIYLDNSPSFLKNTKIVHLSDIHSINFGWKEKKLLEILKKINPDFIFISGDIVDKKTTDFDSCKEFWRNLSIDYQGKIFGVYGNHDFRNPDFQYLDSILEEEQIKILRNESVEIKINENFFSLIGVDDPYLNKDDIIKATKEVGNKSFKILLAHSPEIFRKAKDINIDLVLVGHTHGCQINIPFLCDLILPLKYDKKYKKGFFQEGFSRLYVNSGIGETFMPIRINAPPEIVLITFN